MNKNISNNKFKRLNCTKEVIVCLEKAKQLIHLKGSLTTVTTIHLCLSILFNSKLVQKILNFNISMDQIQLVLNTLFNCTVFKNKEIKNKFYKIYFSLNILKILNVLNSSTSPFNTITLFYYLWKQNPTIYTFIFTILNIKYDSFYYSLKKYIIFSMPKIQIPCILKDIITNIKTTKTTLFERTEELIKINEILTRNLNRNVILLGEEGVGKFSIVQKLKSLTPSKIFLELNCTLLLKIANNNNTLNLLFDFLKKQSNILLYCRNFHILFDNNTSENIYLNYLLLNTLKLNKIQIIGTSSNCLYDKAVTNCVDLNLIFSKINIKELNKHSIKLIMKQYISSVQPYWFHSTTDLMLDNIIKLSNKYIKTTVMPQKVLLILDTLCSIKKKKIQEKDILKSIIQYSELPDTLILKENSTLNNISNIDVNLKKCVFGQDIAITKISTSLKRAFIGLKDKNKPIGSWLLCGPSGTGKTELVKSLAHLLFGSEKELIRFDMGEFMEKHSISKLIGPPPGYVGFEEGGLLTESVKKKPYAVILFDEIEKAHKDINNVMLQLLDEGMLTDSKGQHVDFTNTVIIYTSNLGCPTSPLSFKSFQKGTDISTEEYKILSKKVDIAVKNFFKPEFLNRLDSTIIFKPLSVSSLINVIDKFILKLRNKLKENNINLYIDLEEEIKLLIAQISYHPLYGARPLKRFIEQFIEKPISDLIFVSHFEKPHLFSIYIDKEKETISYLIKKLGI